MNCRGMSILMGILVVVSLASSGADEEDADVRAVLEAGQKAKALPENVLLRVDAQLSRAVPADAAVRPEAERKGADFKKSLRETWEFTTDRVHRVVMEGPGKVGGKVVYRRVESIPFDCSGICQELLDAKICTLGDEEEGERMQFVGTDYELGHRQIEIFIDGKSALVVGESCLVAGLAESDARAFAALYENLATKARKAFALNCPSPRDTK